MSLLDQVLATIRCQVSESIKFKEFETKKYFVVNGEMTNVYLNGSLFLDLENMNTTYGEFSVSPKLVENISGAYIEALQNFMEKNKSCLSE